MCLGSVFWEAVLLDMSQSLPPSPPEITGSVMRAAEACEEGRGNSNLSDKLSKNHRDKIHNIAGGIDVLLAGNSMTLCTHPTPRREGSAMGVGTPWSRVLPESRDGGLLTPWDCFYELMGSYRSQWRLWARCLRVCLRFLPFPVVTHSPGKTSTSLCWWPEG